MHFKVNRKTFRCAEKNIDSAAKLTTGRVNKEIVMEEITNSCIAARALRVQPQVVHNMPICDTNHCALANLWHSISQQLRQRRHPSAYEYDSSHMLTHSIHVSRIHFGYIWPDTNTLLLCNVVITLIKCPHIYAFCAGSMFWSCFVRSLCA